MLQTADVIIYDAHYVPVGEDQVPHLELSREIVRRFHNFYGELFVEPQPLLTTFPAAYVVWALARGSLGAAAGVAAVVWVISTTLLADSARRFAFGRGPEGLLLPVMGPCLAGVALASALGATVRQGIVWRGTRYALSDLKAGAVCEAHWPTDNAPG